MYSTNVYFDSTKRVFDQVAAHICDDPVAWSMSDFQAVRAGTFVRDIQAVLAMCERHVNGCQLCTARGFVCELCPRKLVIFPWQANVHRCRTCGVCVHSGCAREPCGRCERLLCYQMAVAD